MTTASPAPICSAQPWPACHEAQLKSAKSASTSVATISQSRLENIKLREFVDAAERYRTQFLWLANRITNSSEDAEDIVQQALLNAFRKLSGFRGESQMRTWLNAIVQNTAREHIRKQRRRSFVPLDSSTVPDGELEDFDIPDRRMSPEEHYDHRERDRIVDAAIGGLPPANRQVVHMCVFDELPYMQVATVLNLSISTVKSRMFRSRRDLRAAISNYAGSIG